MKNYNYIGIKNKIGILKKLKNMGYEWYIEPVKDNIEWLFINIGHNIGRNCLFVGDFNNSTDIEINIDHIPLRKDLDEYVKMINNGIKLGLL